MLLEKDKIVSDINELINGYRFCEGFIFTAILHPANVFDAIVIRNPSSSRKIGDKGVVSIHSLEKHIEFINKHNIDKALIIGNDISFLRKCPTLKYLNIIFCENTNLDFAFSILYGLPEVISLRCYIKGKYEQEEAKIDYTKIKGLLDIGITYHKEIGFRCAPNLKRLDISKYDEQNLKKLFSSKSLDTLVLNESKIRTLDGIENAPKMQCLYLEYNRQLQDINKLEAVKNTLKELRIEKCSRITDFSVLSQLKELEYLYLKGNNKIPNLDFLKELPKLKTFDFDIEIEDGNLLPCLNLSFVRCRRMRRHYNVREKDLPKGILYRGNENIEPWRRLHH